MAWGRLALIHAAGESDETLEKIAQLFGYEHEPIHLHVNPIEYGFSSTTELTVPTTADETPKRPPALFIVISQLKTKPSITPEPDTLSGSPPELSSEGSYRFKAAEPLLTMARLIPLLHNGLGQKRKGNNLDLSRLSSQLAKGKALTRLPYLPRQVWSQRVQIIVDARLDLEPYWGDFEFIVDELKKRLGQEAVSAIRFDEDSINHEQAYCQPYPARSNDSWYRWQEPADDVAVLILSDLNAKHWRYLSKRLQARTPPMLTLSPSRNTPNDVNLCQLLKPNPLNDSQPVRRHPYQKGFTLKLPEEKLPEIFALLSVLPLIDTALLRRLRKALQWGGSELEHFIWQHPDVVDNGLGIYFPKEAAEKYRQPKKDEEDNEKFWKDSEQFWQIVNEHHATAFQGLTCLEGLNQYAMQPNKRLDDNIKRYYQYLVTRLNTEQTNSALQAQAQAVIALTPNCILDTEISPLLHRIAALSHNETQRQQLLNQGYDLYELEENPPNIKTQMLWYIVQQGQGHYAVQKNAHPLSIATLSTKHSPVQRNADGKQQIIQDGQVFTLNEAETVNLETETEQLQLKAITKPDWATGIWRDSQGLFVSVNWRGKHYTLPWRVTEHSDWVWKPPFGKDEYGIYADLTINKVSQRFRWIEAGWFLMGSPSGEPKRNRDEQQHQVTFTQGYWLADTACTQALWLATMGGENPAYFKEDLNNPVEQVSWDDVQDFLNKLNQLIPDLNARLPTEAEWEYACRAGKIMPFSFGDNITPEQVNYDGNNPYNNGEKGLYRKKIVAVKSLPPNDWGLYEMHGNVWEWCQDRYGDYSSEPVTNPTGVIEGTSCVLRGGSWDGSARRTRSANRNLITPNNRNRDFGFRFALGHT
jgi:formylglycine-generating enzyme required for sulfatase activity